MEITLTNTPIRLLQITYSSKDFKLTLLGLLIRVGQNWTTPLKVYREVFIISITYNLTQCLKKT